MAQRRLEVLITGNAKDAQKAFGDLEKSAAKSGKKTESSLSKMQKGLVGLGLAGAAIGSFKAFEESEKVARQTEAVIKSTGGEAQVTADHIGDLASEMSKLGGVDDEMVQSGANMLLTFTKVRNEVGKGNDIFDQATLAANNYAAATGTDVVAANKMLGVSLNDPVKGMAKLTKAGVSFTQQQKDQVAQMVAAGDTLGAQKLILSEFTKQYGGSLEANATASGKAQVALENMGESVGAILAPAMTTAAQTLGGLAEAFSAMPQSAQTAILGIGGVGAAALIAGPRIADMASTMGSGVSAIKGFATSMSTAVNATAAANNFTKPKAAVEALKSSVLGLSPAMVAGSVATAGITSALVYMTVESERTKNNIRDLQKQIELGMDPADAVAEKLTKTLAGLDGGFEGLSGSSKQFRKNLKEAGLTATEVAQIIAMPADEWKRYSKELLNASGMNKHQASEMVSNLALMRDAQTGAIEADKIRTQVSGELGVKTDEVTSSTGELADATGEATRAGGGWLASNRDLIGAFQERITKQQEINDGMQEAIDLSYASVDANLALRSAHDSVQDATIALDEARKNGSSPETIQRSQDDLTAAIMRESVATRDAAVANAEAAGKSLTAGEAARIQRDKLVELQQQTGFTSGELRGLVTNLDNAARQRQVQLDTSQAIANIRSLIGALGDLSAVGSATGAAGSIINAGVAGVLGNLGPPRARGGDVHAGGMNLVGERGPELVRWGASGTVIPAAKTKQIMAGGTSLNGGTRGYGGGGSVTNIWNITETTSARATANEVARILNRETRMGRNPLVGANG